MTPRGLEFLANQEGIVLHTYLDVAHIPTKGVGHTNNAGPPSIKMGDAPWTKQFALQVLENDLKKFDARVNKAIPHANSYEHDGATSFDFNTGAIHKASWVTFFNAGNREMAKQKFMEWVNAGGKVIGGLERRRIAEWLLITRGDYGPNVSNTIDTNIPVIPLIDEVKWLQTSLQTLGLYKGSIDGLAGPQTSAAVKNFQKTHPGLIVDGIVGPATKAQIQRALDMRKKLKLSVAVGVPATIATMATPVVSGIPVALIPLGVVCAAAGYVSYRYRNELRQMMSRGKEIPYGK